MGLDWRFDRVGHDIQLLAAVQSQLRQETWHPTQSGANAT
jgi:hypothetical protein